jgi:hypothetical protein
VRQGWNVVGVPLGAAVNETTFVSVWAIITENESTVKRT